MKKVWGWYKAWGYVEVEDNATEDEMKEAMAKHMSWENATWLSAEDITLEGVEEIK